jgi:arginase
MIEKIGIVGSQMDLGASRKGVDMGPLAIRHAGLISKIRKNGLSVEDFGDVIVDVAEEVGDPKLRYAKEINSANKHLFDRVKNILEDGSFPVIVGGDHGIAAGSIPAVAEHYGRIGVIWVDAHGDFNDEKITPTDNMHGMPLSAVCGLGPDCMVEFSGARIDPHNVVIIGARDLDPLEKEKLHASGVTVFTISDVHTMGMPDIAKQAVRVAAAGTEGIHLSLDMDGIDPAEAPGVGTPVQNGLTLRETYIALEIINKYSKLLSMDVVEVNPLLDTRNRTGALAVDLILTALGNPNY